MSNQNSNPPRNVSANNKMLIDATHPEETRVVVQRNGRVEEFDFESAARKLLRGNIYLAKVTRVEPSLQAAFVDYGGNRHGFLAFNEIHPDYYQIPVADRRALIEAETAAEAEEEEAADRAAEAAARRSRRRGGPRPKPLGDAEDGAVDVSSMLPPEPIDEAGDANASHDDREEHDHTPQASSRDDDDRPREMSQRSERDPAVHDEPREEAHAGEPAGHHHDDHSHDHGSHDHSHWDDGHHDDNHRDGLRRDDAGEAGGGEGRVETVESGNGAEAEQIETVSVNEDVLEEVPVRPRRRLRSYKIQEVTKRRQVLLVQVVKEERGTKGAALTTYLSLAGRYTVLMPNTARGGGISRKINNPQDRKRLKAIAAELDVPEGMGLIIRTAGAAQTMQEIKRDYEYLLRLWESVRELALGSNAPALVYEEGNLIKRSIRDLYGKEVEEIVVAGAEAFREARDFMRMLMPSHAKNVHYYEEPEPLFTRFGMERQLNAMFSPYVHLRSGGYLVINQTEALVAIDINSGKSTREFSIEETALSTNLEAADEIARQLKLRDLAGLVVIDFIDMEEKRNNRNVERRLKDALRHDRARIQLGRISHFGLLEMSRQRMRTGVLEGSTTQCPHCQGTGIIRSTESVALAVLRGLEDAQLNGPPASLIATTTSTVALYILNHKRSFIVEMEGRYGITIQIIASEKVQGANFTVERQARQEEPVRRTDRTAVNMDWGFEDEEQDPEAEADDETEVVAAAPQRERGGDRGGDRGGERGERSAADGEGQNGDGRRRRRRGRRGDREGDGEQRNPRGESGGERADASYASRSTEDRPSYAGDEIEEVGEGRGYPDDEPGPERDQVIEPGMDASEADGDDEDAGADEAGVRGEAGDGQQGEKRRRRRRGRRGGRRNQQRERQGSQEGGDGEVRDELQPRAAVDRDEAGRVQVRDDEPRHEDHIHVGMNGSSDHESVAEAVAPSPAYVQPYRETEPVANIGNVASESVQPPTSRVPEVPPTAVVDRYPEPVQAAPVAAIEPEVVAAPAETPPALPAARSAPVASEPVLERVVVGPDAAATQASEDPSRPARRGWWQRR